VFSSHYTLCNCARQSPYTRPTWDVIL
jgi:hypothetical protein